MLLPQGEFARFLRADDDDRRELLTKLFGTQLYDRVTAELDRRRAEANQARQDAERAVVTAVAVAAEAAGLDEDARAELLSLPRADRATRLKEIAEELATRVCVTGDALGVAAAAVEAAQARDEEAGRQAALMTRLTEALAALSTHERERPGHEQRAGRLAAARRAEPVRPLLAGLADAGSVTAAARESLLTAAAGDGRPVDLPEGQGGPPPDLLEGQGGAEAAARADAAEREALGLEHLAGQEASLPGLAEDLAALEQAAQEASLRAAALEEARSELPARISRLEGELGQARSAAAGLAALAARAEAVTGQHDAAAAAAGLGPQVEAARSALQAAVDEHQALVDAHQGLIEARLNGMAAELAARIADGGPCPVCGSVDHPAPACPADGAVSAADVDEAAARRDEAAKERSQREAEHADLALAEAACIAQAGGRDAGDLAAELAALAGEIAAAEQAASEAAGLEADLAAARGELETSASDLRAAEKQATAAGEQARAARDSLEHARAEVAGAAGAFGSVAARQASLREGAARDRALAQALDKLSAALADEGKARARAEREALAQGFGSLDEARTAVIDPAGQDELAAEVESWTGTLARLEAAAHATDLAGLDPGQAQETGARAAAAAAALARAREAEQEVRDAHQAAKVRAERLAGGWRRWAGPRRPMTGWPSRPPRSSGWRDWPRESRGTGG